MAAFIKARMIRAGAVETAALAASAVTAAKIADGTITAAKLAPGVASGEFGVATELTIAAGVITTTGKHHTVDTQADAASDDLDTINGISEGEVVLLRPASAARTVVLKHGTGNIKCPQGLDISLAESADMVLCTSDGGAVVVIAHILAAGETVKTDTISESSAGAGVTVDGANIKDGYVNADYLVKATIAVANATGGATDSALTVALTRLSGDAVASARQVLIMAAPNGNIYQPAPPLGSTVTFSAATVGSIVASGTGWALVQTDASGAFACTVSNSADETRQFSVTTPQNGLSDVTKLCMVVGSNVDAAVWSA